DALPSCSEEVTIVEDSGADSCTITAEVQPENSRVCVCSVCGGYGLESEFMRGGRYCSPGCCRSDNQLEPDSDEGERKTRRIEINEDCKENIENRLSNRDKDHGDFSQQSKTVNPRCPWLDQRSQFSWVKYIEYCQKVDGHGKAAPLKLWSEPFPSSKNLFQPGMKLEGIDPLHQSLFCVLTVVDVMGHRVKLHFDGYSDLYDFWTYADSPNLFPVGWCERNGRDLCPPRGTLRFSWKNYLEQCGGVPAPRQAFANKACRQTSKTTIVQPGRKLEAEDRKNGWVCVATAQDVLDKRILVHFDGWGSTYDVWTDITSPFIHPVGWCAENDVQLYAPQDYVNPESFNWPEYLRETNTSAVPAKALKPRQPKDFKKDMKLEVVDKRNPMLVRVATISEVYNYQIKIHFDGWDDMYDYWVDDDSEDIHPPSWCNKTGHPLQPPMTDEAADTNGCGVLGCKGYGHIKGPIYTTHHTSFGCPYSVQNYNKDLDVLIPDRVLAKPEKKSRKFAHKSLLLDLGSGDLDDEDSLKKRVRKRRRFFDEISAPENKAKISKPFPDSVDAANPAEANLGSLNSKDQEQSADVEVHQSVFCGGFLLATRRSPLPNWRHVKHLLAPLKDVDRDTVLEWTSEEVGAAIEQLPGCEGVAEEFTAQKVDGEALLLITQDDLVQQLNLKLGHALKIMAFVDSLRFKE
ncbi:Mbt repeat, partial [Trinorchestia longiramus]